MFRIMPTKISDETLVSIFNSSPLSRRIIRNRLNKPPNSVVSAVLFSACKRKIIFKVRPRDVGSLKKSIHVYDIYRQEEKTNSNWSLFGLKN